MTNWKKLADTSIYRLNTPVGEDAEYGDFMPAPDGEGVEDGAVWHVAKQEIQELCLQYLNTREARILEYRFQKGMTLVEIGEEMGITRERVRQIEGKALKKMRKYAEENGLREYLR